GRDPAQHDVLELPAPGAAFLGRPERDVLPRPELRPGKRRVKLPRPAFARSLAIRHNYPCVDIGCHLDCVRYQRYQHEARQGNAYWPEDGATATPAGSTRNARGTPEMDRPSPGETADRSLRADHLDLQAANRPNQAA